MKRWHASLLIIGKCKEGRRMNFGSDCGAVYCPCKPMRYRQYGEVGETRPHSMTNPTSILSYDVSARTRLLVGSQRDSETKVLGCLAVLNVMCSVFGFHDHL